MKEDVVDTSAEFIGLLSEVHKLMDWMSVVFEDSGLITLEFTPAGNNAVYFLNTGHRISELEGLIEALLNVKENVLMCKQEELFSKKFLL